MALLLYLLFLVRIFLQISNSTSSQIPEHWRDYISPDMLEKYEGVESNRYSENFFQGDIDGVDKDLSKDQLKGILNNAITDKNKRWPNGIVPYTLSHQYKKDEKLIEKTLILEGMSIIASSTGNCIQFIPKTNQKDYIHISRGINCYSSVGKQGGKQIISYTTGCLEDIGEIQHELMHALGFYHEHTRTDRNEYVWINWENLLPQAKTDFNIPTDVTTFGLPYDYQSVLHYGFNDFAINNHLPTIVPKEKSKRIGQRINLSILDILKLRRAYNCPDADEIIASKTVPSDQATIIAEMSNTNHETSVIATTAAQVETTGQRKIHLRRARPKPPDLTLPDFMRGNLSDVECKALNTENCIVQSWANCSNGYFAFDCGGSSTEFEIRYHLEKIKRAIPSSPIEFAIGVKTELKPEIFQSVSDNIVAFQIYSTDGFNCNVLRDLPLPNLLQLMFYHSTNIRVNRDSLRPFLKMRFLVFWESTIISMEKGSLKGLISLKTIAFDYGIAFPLSLDEKSYLWRLHCSVEYSWLRDYFDRHPDHIQPRKHGEIYSLPGLVNREWTKRMISYPVDCSRDDLTGDRNQVEFSLNEQVES